MLDLFFPDKKFWKNILILTLPIMIQNTSTAILALIDNSILKSLGDASMSAVSLAAQLTFITANVIFGISSGASIYLSRYFGEKNPKKVNETFLITLILCLAVNLCVAFVALVLPEVVMGIFTDKKELISLGSDYLRICAPSYVCTALSSAMISLFRSAKKATHILVPSFIAIGLKTVLTYIFVNGVGPLESMGVSGAALSTTIAKATELSIYLILYFFCFKKDYRLSLSHFKAVTGQNLKSFIKSVLPVILNEGLWATGLALFSIIFGRMSIPEIAALNIAKTLEELFNSMFYGIGIGAVVVLGQLIGEKQYELAKKRAFQYMIFGIEVGFVILVLMSIFGGDIIHILYKGLSDETLKIANVLILEFALLMPFRSGASAIIMGLMRAGGKSKLAMLYDTAPVYLFSLPVGIVLGLVFKLPIVIVLPAMYAKRIIKFALAFRTALRGEWASPELMKD